MTKKLVEEKIGEFPVSDLTGTFSEMIKMLKEKENYYWSRNPDAEYFFVQFEIDDHEDSYSRYEQFAVYQKRMETDKEYRKRKEKFNYREDKEYKVYLKLKEKYEKPSK